MLIYDENWDDIINELDDDEHGGVYIEDESLHIKPINQTRLNTLFQKEYNNIVIDPIAKYTIEELKNAKSIISQNRDELDVNSIATSNKNNSLIVTSSFWNEEKSKQ